VVNSRADQNDEEPTHSTHRNGENLHSTTFAILVVFVCIYAQQVAETQAIIMDTIMAATMVLRRI
jgi:hypothetical protein